MKNLKSTKTAKTISNVLSPFTVAPTCLGLVTYRVTESPSYTFLTTLYAILFVVVPTLGYILVQMKRKVIGDIHVRDRKQRYPIYVIGIISLTIYINFLIITNAPVEIIKLILSVAVLMFINSIINLKTKVSLHTGSMGGLLAVACVFFSQSFILIALLLGMAVSWARYELKAHTMAQIVLGMFNGFVITLIAFL